MELLKELVYLVNNNKVKNIEILDPEAGSGSILLTLYQEISKGEIQTDEDAIEKLYKGRKGSNRRLYKLKGRLFERLYNTLFFIDVTKPGFSDFQKAYYQCYKDYASIKILAGRSASRLAIPLAEKTFKKALKYEFTELIIALGGMLRSHYVVRVGNRKKATFYSEQVKKYLHIQSAEQLAEEYFNLLAINYVTSKSSKFEMEKLAIKYSEELMDLLQGGKSYKLILNSYQVFSLRYQIVNDYINTLHICEEAIQLFQTKKKLTTRTAIFLFSITILTCHIHLKNYREGKFIGQQCLKLAPEGSRNWFLALENYIILAFHSRDYPKALELFQTGYRHPNFKKRTDSGLEQWQIFEAYLNFFIVLGRLSPGLNQEGVQIKRFRIGRFLNEVHTYAKDKRGGNISIIIIQLLFLLQRKEYGPFIDRVEALDAYRVRHLRRNETFRSNCFLKMLLELPNAHFNRVAAKRKTAKYYKRLLEVPLEKAQQGSEIEIVPYETLWNHVLELLDTKFH